jgi:hypothetical protein
MKTIPTPLTVTITVLAFSILSCVHAIAAESAALEPVRLQLSNDLAVLTATNDGSRTTLKTIHTLSNALAISWSTNSDELILSRLVRVLRAARLPQYDPLLLEAGAALREGVLSDFSDLALFVQVLPPTIQAGPVAEHFALLARSQQGQIYGPIGQRLKAATNTVQISAALVKARSLFTRAQASANRFLMEIRPSGENVFTADFQLAKSRFKYGGSASATLEGTNILLSLRADSDSSPVRGLPHLDFTFFAYARLVPWEYEAPGVFVTDPAEAFGSLSFTTDGVNSGGGAAYSVDIWAFVTGNSVVGVFDVIGPSWLVTHGHFVALLERTSAGTEGVYQPDAALQSK